MDVPSFTFIGLILSFVSVQSQLFPGPVSDLIALAKFTSVDLTWSAPQEPNGVIISYEVTYRVTGDTLKLINTTDSSTTFSIPSLPPQTTVSDLSVSAYNRIGRGETAKIDDQITLDNSTVENIKVKTLSATAVRVSWNSVAIPEITGYIIYYSSVTGSREKQIITVTSSVTSVNIVDLLNNVRYHFQVAIIAEVKGEQFLGETGLTTGLHTISSCTRDCEIVIGAIFSYELIVILVTILLFYWKLRKVYRLKDTIKSRIETLENPIIKQLQTNFKINAGETLEHEQNPDINKLQSIDLESDSDKKSKHEEESQTTDLESDTDETLEHDKNQNKSQTIDLEIDTDETLEHDKNQNKLQTIDLEIDTDETLEHDKNQNKLQTIDLEIDTDETLKNSDQSQTIDSESDTDETLTQNTDAQNKSQTTDLESDTDETLTQNTDAQNKSQTTDLESDTDETLTQNTDTQNKSQTTDLESDTDEIFEHDKNQDVDNKSQTTDKSDTDETLTQSTDVQNTTDLESDTDETLTQNTDVQNKSQTTDLESDSDETVTCDQNPDQSQATDFKIDDDKTLQQISDFETDTDETLEHDKSPDVEKKKSMPKKRRDSRY